MPTETEVQCARCGSSLFYEDCEMCPACGWYDRYDPSCPACHGSGRVPFCCSTEAFCQANPLPGREHVERHTVETFTTSVEVPRLCLTTAAAPRPPRPELQWGSTG